MSWFCHLVLRLKLSFVNMYIEKQMANIAKQSWGHFMFWNPFLDLLLVWTLCYKISPLEVHDNTLIAYSLSKPLHDQKRPRRKLHMPIKRARNYLVIIRWTSTKHLWKRVASGINNFNHKLTKYICIFNKRLYDNEISYRINSYRLLLEFVRIISSCRF